MYFNLRLNKITLLLLFVASLFTACQKDADLPTEPNNSNANQRASFFQLQDQANSNTGEASDSASDLELECFTFVYPINIVFPGGEAQTVNSNEDLEVVVYTWLDQNPNSEEFPTFEFPIQVNLPDGSTQSIDDEETLCALVETCWEDDVYYYDTLDIDLDLAFCFEIVYPVELVLPDGTTQTANNDQELGDIIYAWYEANPNSEEFPTFNYPINVLLDGESQTVNSDEELEAMFGECEYDEGLELCFAISYPVQIVFPDGSTADINSDEALEEAVDNWYTQNPNSMDDPTFAYPIEVTLEDGTVQSISNDEELTALFDECFDDDCEVNGERLLLGGQKATLTKAVMQRH